jgi:hypothetical protein
MITVNNKRLPSHCKESAFSVFLVLCASVLLLLSGCSKTNISVKKPSLKGSLGECVILMHGMGRTYHAMESMQEILAANGYHTVNLDYPSTRYNIQVIADEYFPQALEQCRKFSPSAIHFVTHSLGGIVLRQAIKENRPAELGRAVMLSPPNRGSFVADTLQDWWFYEWALGPAGQQLTTAHDSVPNQLGPVDYPVGIITGDRYAFFDAWLSYITPGQDDGKVAVERARLDGMSDFLVVHDSHTFIMNSQYVQMETVHFLQNGAFKHQKEPLPSVSGGDWFSFPSK